MDYLGQVCMVDLNSTAEEESYKFLKDVSCYYGLKIIDGFAYCAGEKTSIVKVDSQTEIKTIKQFETENAFGIGSRDGRVFLFDEEKGIQILHSDPPEEAFIGDSISPEVFNSIWFDGDRGIGMTMTGDIKFFDFTDPINPALKATFTSPNYMSRIYLNDDCAYIAAGQFYLNSIWFNGLQTLDISDPSNQQVKSSLRLKGEINEIAIDDKYIYAAASKGGLHILDISNKFEPELICTFTYSESIMNLTYSNGYIYCYSKDLLQSSSGGNVLILDAGDRSELHVVKSVPILYDDDLHCRSILTLDGYVFVAVKGGIQIIDARDPENSKTMGFFDLPVADTGEQYCAETISLYENNLFVSAVKSDEKESTIFVLDPLPIEKIGIVNTLEVEDYPGDIVIRDQLLFLNGKEQIDVFNYNGPTKIEYLGSFLVGNRICSFDAKDEIVYVIQNQVGLRIFDICDE